MYYNYLTTNLIFNSLYISEKRNLLDSCGLCFFSYCLFFFLELQKLGNDMASIVFDKLCCFPRFLFIQQKKSTPQ